MQKCDVNCLSSFLENSVISSFVIVIWLLAVLLWQFGFWQFRYGNSGFRGSVIKNSFSKNRRAYKMKSSLFGYRPEEKQNPYIGFVSFQHFSGEKLYSDITVLPENRMTETERVECFPVSPDAEELGRDQGWYPDNTVAYIRILWKEFEPKREEYDYAFIERILDEAKRHGQTVLFRLMAHSTRASDDVPEWLKELIPCPERPPMERIKDSPTDPLFMGLFLKAVRKIGERFDSNPYLDGVDISLPGAWGEGYKLDLYSDDLLNTIMDTYLEAFPTTQLYTQISRPNLIDYASGRADVGWRGDGLGNPYPTKEYYPPRIERLADNWKKAPVSFESYWWMGEWQRQGWEIDTIIEKTLDWHISTFNPKSMPIPYSWREKCEKWIRRMGYHFTIKSAQYPESVKCGERFTVKLEIENCGSAPCYKPLRLVLRARGSELIEFEQDVDTRKLLPGTHSLTLSGELSCDLPSDLYDLEIALISPHGDTIYLATDAPYNDGGYLIGNISVVKL